jgi:hypothetical protein
LYPEHRHIISSGREEEEQAHDSYLNNLILTAQRVTHLLLFLDLDFSLLLGLSLSLCGLSQVLRQLRDSALNNTGCGKNANEIADLHSSAQLYAPPERASRLTVRDIQIAETPSPESRSPSVSRPRFASLWLA